VAVSVFLEVVVIVGVIVFVTVIRPVKVAQLDTVDVFVLDTERVCVGDELPVLDSTMLFVPVNERIIVPDCKELCVGVFDPIGVAVEVPEELCDLV
jgi:hypothetical protein